MASRTARLVDSIRIRTRSRRRRARSSLVAVVSLAVLGSPVISPAANASSPAEDDASNLRIGVLALAGAISAVGQTPELSTPLPFTTTSLADVLELDEQLTANLTSALAGRNLEDALDELEGVQTDRGRRSEPDHLPLLPHGRGPRARAGPRRRRPAVRAQRRRRQARRLADHPPLRPVRGGGRREPAGPAAAGGHGQPAGDGPRGRHRDREPRGLRRPAGLHRARHCRRPLPAAPRPRDRDARPGRPRPADAGGPPLLHPPRPVPDHPGRRRGRRRGLQGRPARHPGRGYDGATQRDPRRPTPSPPARSGRPPPTRRVPTAPP